MRRWVFHIVALTSTILLVITIAGTLGAVRFEQGGIRLSGATLELGTARGYWHLGRGEAEMFNWWVGNALEAGRADLVYDHVPDSFANEFRLPGVDVYYGTMWRKHDWFVIVQPWFTILLTSLPPLFWLRANILLRRARRRLEATGRCAACGYDLQGSAGDCPECGATPHV